MQHHLTFREELAAFGQREYDDGYHDARENRPYRGRTFIGYYGWCDGRDDVANEGEPCSYPQT